MQRIIRTAFTLGLIAVAASATAGELKLTIANGRATLIAQDVTARVILTEWARLGGTTIVNGDKVLGPLLTVTMIDRPEREVLDVVLRSVSGYVAAPRAEFVANLSIFDRIMILPTSVAPAYTPIVQTTPSFTRPNPALIVEDDPVEPIGTPQGILPPGVAPQTMQTPGMPNPPPARPGMPTNQPLTADRPGMLPPPQTPPANPFVPNQVPPPARPPGGGTIIK
jgi:hypothetical protein